MTPPLTGYQIWAGCVTLLDAYDASVTSDTRLAPCSLDAPLLRFGFDVWRTVSERAKVTQRADDPYHASMTSDCTGRAEGSQPRRRRRYSVCEASWRPEVRLDAAVRALRRYLGRSGYRRLSFAH